MAVSGDRSHTAIASSNRAPFHSNRLIVLLFDVILGISDTGFRGQDNLRSVFQWLISPNYFLALPYVFYIKFLTSSYPDSPLLWIYYTCGNLPPVLCFLWSRTVGGQRCVRNVVTDLQSRDLWVQEANKILIRSVICTFLLQAVYLFWLLSRPTFPHLTLWLKTWFVLLGITFFLRLVIVFVVVEIFFLDLRRVRYQMELLNDQTQLGTCRIEWVMGKFIEVDAYMLEGMERWWLSVLGFIAVPIITFTVQLVLTAYNSLDPKNDFFFLIYEAHYFIIALLALSTAAENTHKWRMVAHTMRLRLCTGELIFLTDSKENGDTATNLSGGRNDGGTSTSKANRSIVDQRTVQRLQTFLSLLSYPNGITLFDRRIDRTLVLEILYITVIAVAYMLETFRRHDSKGSG